MTNIGLEDIPGYKPLTQAHKDRISKTILPKLDDESLEILFKHIEKLAAFDRMNNRPGPETPLHRRLNQLKGQLDKCVATIEKMGAEGTQLDNFDLHYWQANDQDRSMQDFASELREQEGMQLSSEEEAREYFSVSGTQEILRRIQKAVSNWHRLSKPPSKRGRNLPTNHQNLIYGLIDFFEKHVPVNTYKISYSAESRFGILVGFIFHEVLETGTTDASSHIKYVLKPQDFFK